MNEKFIQDLSTKLTTPEKTIEIDYNDFDDIVNSVFPFLHYEIVQSEELNNGSNFISNGWYDELGKFEYKDLFNGKPNTNVLIQILINLGVFPKDYKFVIAVNW